MRARQVINSAAVQFAVALSAVLAVFFVTSLLTMLITTAASEWVKTDVGLMILQAVQSIMLFGFSTCVGIRLTEKEPILRLVKANRLPSAYQLLIIVLFAILVFPGVNLLADWNKSISLPDAMADFEASMREMEQRAQAFSLRFLYTGSGLQLAANILVMAMIPAVCEELMFRGWLLRRLAKCTSRHAAVLISAAVFSFIHFQFFGFVPRMLMGMALGYIYLYTGSLFAPILVHFMNNAVVVILSYVEHNYCAGTPFSLLGFGDTLYVGMASLAVSVALLWLLSSSTSKKKDTGLKSY